MHSLLLPSYIIICKIIIIIILKKKMLLLFDHLLLPLFQCYVAVNMLLYFFFSNGYGRIGGRTHNLRHKRNCVITLYYTTYCIIYTGMYTYVCLWGKKNYIFYNHRTFHSNDTT